jgi:hypothetical protein
MPPWCRQVNWRNSGIPWLNCAVLLLKDAGKTVLRPVLLPVKTAQFTQFIRQVWHHTVKSLSLTENVLSALNTEVHSDVTPSGTHNNHLEPIPRCHSLKVFPRQIRFEYILFFHGWSGPRSFLWDSSIIIRHSENGSFPQNDWSARRRDIYRLIHTYHAFPLTCRATKVLDCVFPIWFTQWGRVPFAHALLCPCHAMTIILWQDIKIGTKLPNLRTVA